MTDYSGLVERLSDDTRGRMQLMQDSREAAAAIEAQRERIERLEGALRVFIDITGGERWGKWEYMESSDLYSAASNALAAARAALEAKL